MVPALRLLLCLRSHHLLRLLRSSLQTQVRRDQRRLLATRGQGEQRHHQQPVLGLKFCLGLLHLRITGITTGHVLRDGKWLDHPSQHPRQQPWEDRPSTTDSWMSWWLGLLPWTSATPMIRSGTEWSSSSGTSSPLIMPLRSRMPWSSCRKEASTATRWSVPSGS